MIWVQVIEMLRTVHVEEIASTHSGLILHPPVASIGLLAASGPVAYRTRDPVSTSNYKLWHSPSTFLIRSKLLR